MTRKQNASIRLDPELIQRIDNTLAESAKRQNLPPASRNSAVEMWIIEGIERIEHKLKTDAEHAPNSSNTKA
jgi:predicted transcriptional regulator